MEINEIRQIANDVNDLTEEIIREQIIRGQRTINDIKEEIRQTSIRPFEQDNIYEDHYGNNPREAREQEINGVTITSRILHQTGLNLRDIAGADLLYEIDGVKFILVQYKRPDNKNRVIGDIPQLKNLIASCPVNCNGKPPDRLNGFCGSWYNIQNETESQYILACEAFKTFGRFESRYKKYFAKGLSKKTFI